MLTRVLLADGCAFTRDGLCAFLVQNQIEIIEQAHDWEALAHLIEKYSPLVIVLGSKLPGLSGPADFAIKQRDVVASPRWLVFGEQDTIVNARAWLEAGAWGYAWKGDVPELLLTAIQTVRQGHRWLSPNLKEDPGSDLSPNEWQFLNWLAQGFTNEWMACQTSLSLRTVKYHLTHLYDKLGVSGRTEAAAWAARHRFGQV